MSLARRAFADLIYVTSGFFDVMGLAMLTRITLLALPRSPAMHKR